MEQIANVYMTFLELLSEISVSLVSSHYIHSKEQPESTVPFSLELM